MKSWHDALEDCISKGSDLMSIQDLHERVRRIHSVTMYLNPGIQERKQTSSMSLFCSDMGTDTDRHFRLLDRAKRRGIRGKLGMEWRKCLLPLPIVRHKFTLIKPTGFSISKCCWMPLLSVCMRACVRRYWKEGQPDNWADNEDCGQVQGSSQGKWNDEACTARRQYICKRPNRTYEAFLNKVYLLKTSSSFIYFNHIFFLSS